MQATQTFVTWFRNSSPYIHAHRNKTFVICFGGEAMADDFYNLIHDFALLKSLGIRLVLVHGIRPQIDSRLRIQGIKPIFKDNLRITDKSTLECVKEAAGTVRVEIEAMLSMGLANSPMAGAKIKVASGNFVTAKPLGVIDGIDYGYTGVVRRIEQTAIAQQLDQNNVVLISPLGYSPTGEVFNLTAEHLATEIAIALQAEKLILLSEHECVNPETAELIPQITVQEAEQFLQHYPNQPLTMIVTLSAAILACQRGIERVHLLNRKLDGALLLELFTRDGVGTLISSMPFETLRPAKFSDIGGILELLKPLEQQGKLIKRSPEKLEMEINDYIVIERDGLIIGCLALHLLESEHAGVIASLAVHADYQRAARGQRLFEAALNKASQLGLKQLFALSTQTVNWFIERGFITTDREYLPESLKTYYNPQRNSKILCKPLA